MVLTRSSSRRDAAPVGSGARAVRIGWPAAVLLVAVLALAASLAIGGGAAGPDALLEAARPLASLVLTLAASVTLGAVLLAAFAWSPERPGWSRLLDGAAAAAGVWTVASGSSLLLGYLAIGPRIGSPTFGPNLMLYLTTVDEGRIWLGGTIGAALLTTLLIVVRSHTGVGLMVPLTAAGLVPLALLGHAATAAGDHNTAITALALHVVGAAAWLGGLGVLLVVGLGLRGAPLADLAERYSAIALVAFVVVGYSGIVSASIRTPEPAMLLTPYGQLILVKSAALIAAGLFGALHRTVTIPRLKSGPGRAPFLRLIGVELLVLGIAAGFAAGLGATAPPDQDLAPVTTPAEVLTESPLPPPLTVGSLLTEWRFDPLWVVGCLLMAAFYLVGVRRLRLRGDAWPVGRTVCWLAGTAVLFWLTNGGLNRYQEVLFSAHMLLHMALTMLVPLLLVPAAPVTLALRAIPRRTDGTRGGREWLLLGVHSRFATVVANPVVAAVLFAGSLVAFYWSPLFSWATTDHLGHEWMTVHFLITGFLFVQSLIGIDPVPFRFPYPIRLLVLLATMAFHAFFGLALILGTGLLLPDWYGAMGWGTSALADQRLGGGIAWSVGEIPTLVLAIVVAVSWARSDDREARRRDRHADRTGDADLAAYNAMLGRLGGGA
ncbi:cytochrome c oxidase assembly protein [Amnibacterium endophyticum]|uniref:Cytochrome c oxidase assembly protein n=1 Tax=Amnibacterium endophyticum TaxID=2109337 RepID=A0ABW4LEE7_9MICO